MRPAKLRQAAFTLLEVLAVVGIIILLSALIFRGYTSAMGKRDEKKVEAELKAIEIAIEYYFTDYNYYPPDSFDQTTGNFDASANGLYDSLSQNKSPGKRNYIKGMDPRTDGKGNLVSPVARPAEGAADAGVNLWNYNSHKPDHNPG